MMCLRTHNKYNSRKLKSLDLWSCFRTLVPTVSELSEQTFAPKCVDIWEGGQVKLCTTTPQWRKLSRLSHKADQDIRDCKPTSSLSCHAAGPATAMAYLSNELGVL